MVMPPGPAFFFSSFALRVPIALVLHSSAGPYRLYRSRIAEIHIGLAAVDQIQIGHGFVVVGTVLHCLIQILQSFIDQGGIFAFSDSITFFGAFTLPSPSSLMPAGTSAASVFMCASDQSITPTV